MSREKKLKLNEALIKERERLVAFQAHMRNIRAQYEAEVRRIEEERRAEEERKLEEDRRRFNNGQSG